MQIRIIRCIKTSYTLAIFNCLTACNFVYCY